MEFQHSADDDGRLIGRSDRDRPCVWSDADLGNGEHEYKFGRDLVLRRDCYWIYDRKCSLFYKFRRRGRQSRIDIEVSGYRLRNGFKQPIRAELFQSGPLCYPVLLGQHASDTDSYTHRYIVVWELDRLRFVRHDQSVHHKSDSRPNCDRYF